MDFMRARRTGITMSFLTDGVDHLRYSIGTENTMTAFPAQSASGDFQWAFPI